VSRPDKRPTALESAKPLKTASAAMVMQLKNQHASVYGP
jgi:hypothetical protein